MNVQIVTRTGMKGEAYICFLTNSKFTFKDRQTELLQYNEDVLEVIYSGESSNLLNKEKKLEEGILVDFFDERSRKEFRGFIKKKNNTPYFIIEDEREYQFSVHQKHIKIVSPDFKEISKMFVDKITGNMYRKYEIGVIQSNRTFDTPEESLTDLVEDFTYSILYIDKVNN